MWNRREWLSALAAGTAGTVTLAGRSAAGDSGPAQATGAAGHDSPHAAMMKECIEACGHCEAACDEAFHHCITQAAAGKSEHARMAQMVIDCAAFCTLSAAIMARHSPLMILSCHACGEACQKCAEECGSADHGEIMKHCVQACRACAESCRKMVQMMGGAHHHEGDAGRKVN